jgi:hypothetical protein
VLSVFPQESLGVGQDGHKTKLEQGILRGEQNGEVHLMAMILQINDGSMKGSMITTLGIGGHCHQHLTVCGNNFVNKTHISNDARITMLVRRIKTTSLFVFIIVVSLSMSGCEVSPLCDSEEISRAKSQIGTFYSSVIKENCGATTDDAFKVYVLDSDRPVTDNDSVFIADKVRKLNVQWLSDNELLIEYENARIFSFKNFATFTNGNVTIQEQYIVK